MSVARVGQSLRKADLKNTLDCLGDSDELAELMNRYFETTVGQCLDPVDGTVVRMEGLNKYLGTDVLITGEVQAAVTDKFVTRFCGQFKLKGFEKAVGPGRRENAVSSLAHPEVFETSSLQPHNDRSK